MIITDQRSYRSEEPSDRAEAKPFLSDDFPELFPEEVMAILDAGRVYNGSQPPETIPCGALNVPNFAKAAPPQTILGITQKRWFLNTLKASSATWKIWGSTTATLDMRADPQNLPVGFTKPWPGEGFACFGGGDFSSAFAERAEIYDFVKANGITGFATVAGDRHSFWAGLAAKTLPPRQFDPVGIAFVVGSISAPGMTEALEHVFPKIHPLRALFLGQSPTDVKAQPTINLLLRHGVRSCLEYAESGNLTEALALSNRDLSPHLSFVDMGGHGYAVVCVTSSTIETEFICIPRPVVRSSDPDGGPLLYRARFKSRAWKEGEMPQMSGVLVEGEARFSIG